MVLRRRLQGFTLIEMVMTIMIFGIIAVVVSRTLFHGYQTFMTAQHISDVDWQGFLALERITDDLRTIRSPADITTLQTSQLTFVNVSGSSVQFQLSGSNLLRNGQILASGVQGLTFNYLNSSGATTASAAAVRYIRVSVNVASGGISLPFSTLIAVRSAT